MPSGKQYAKPPDALTIRKMEASDVPKVSTILAQSAEAASWSESSILESARSGIAWVAAEENSVVGFLVGRGVADEFEILNLAVAPLHRRRGIATQLLAIMFAWMGTTGKQHAYLEVRGSNEAAIALYKNHGFSPMGSRARYYQYPLDDAIVLCWNRPART